MDQQIRLRWTSHQGTMMSVFDALLTSESLVDVTLACEGQFIRAHKIILSACSPYFQALISIDAIKHPIFFLKDVKFTELKALIQYMYRGEVSISQEDLPSFLVVAQALKIRGLADVETGKSNISSDTIVLPEHGSKNRVIMPTFSPSSPAVYVAPPSPVVPTPSTSSNIEAPRSLQQLHCRNSSASTALISTAVPSSGPPAKKSRVETRQPTQTPVATKVQKQSQMLDPLLDVDSSNTVRSSLVDPLETMSASPSTSTPYAVPDNFGRSHGNDFRHVGMVEETEPFGTEIKLEANAPIEIDLEEEENSLSHSSFSESWQMGDGDNSQMPDDDGELPGGSGNNDGTGAEGGEVAIEVWAGTFLCPTPGCGRKYMEKKIMQRHLRHECNQPPRFVCGSGCGFKTKWKWNLTKHQRNCRNFGTY